MSEGSPDGDRKTGRVVAVREDFGFISCDDTPGQDFYFKISWFRGSPRLREGDEVTFLPKTIGGRPQAHALARAGEPDVSQEPDPPDAATRAPATDRLLAWAYMGLRSALPDLASFALPEDWEFKNTTPKSGDPAPILKSYLLHTFGRLVLEEKVLVNPEGTLAAFNTGLVDPRYEPIHALFAYRADLRPPWRLSGFSIAGEGPAGQTLVRHFNPLPQPAHYFDSPADLLYDTRAGKPEMDWRHVVIDRIDRYPAEFLEDNWPPGFEARNPGAMTPAERTTYFSALGNAIEGDGRTYRGIMNRLRDAVELAIKRVSWNFKTAVPQYYPRVRRLQLLLPVCLVHDETADMALAVEKTPSGSYLGHTVLPLDWAYRNARLICRPDSDWLAAKEIAESTEADED